MSDDLRVSLGAVLAVPSSDRSPPHDQGSGPRRIGQTRRRGRPRVLIVDDDEDSRELSGWCMMAAGWSVYAVENGAEALLAVPDLEPDVIVMDLRMPVLGGLDAIRQLKRHDATKSVPIVACSAFGQRSSETEARDAGCDEFVAKPFQPEALRDLLEALVARRGDSSG